MALLNDRKWIAALPVFLVLVATACWWTSQGEPSEVARSPFPHAVHVEDQGMDCALCHESAESDDAAGMPTLDACVLCHEFLDEAKPEERRLSTLYAGVEGVIPGRGVALADEVIFSHASHAAAGLDCAECHGEAGRARPPSHCTRHGILCDLPRFPIRGRAVLGLSPGDRSRHRSRRVTTSAGAGDTERPSSPIRRVRPTTARCVTRSRPARNATTGRRRATTPHCGADSAMASPSVKTGSVARPVTRARSAKPVMKWRGRAATALDSPGRATAIACSATSRSTDSRVAPPVTARRRRMISQRRCHPTTAWR